jgi:hypothetical protein
VNNIRTEIPYFVAGKAHSTLTPYIHCPSISHSQQQITTEIITHRIKHGLFVLRHALGREKYSAVVAINTLGKIRSDPAANGGNFLADVY